MQAILANLMLLPWHETLLSNAERLSKEGHNEVAIATAMMACETVFERAFSQLFQHRKIEYFEEPIEQFFPTYSISNDRVRKVYVALSGDEIHTRPFWARFKEFAKLRHEVVHKGTRATPEQAKEAIEVAALLINHIGNVMRELK